MSIKRKFTPAFTIVELLVVVVVIAIIVSITTIGYGSWQDSLARDVVQSELKLVSATMENAKNFANGYPTTVPATYKNNANVTVTYYSGDAKNYCVDGRHVSRTDVRYYINASKGKNPLLGNCAANGDNVEGGVAPSTPVPSAVAASTTSLNITWPAVSGATSYVVRYGTSSPTGVASCTTSPCVLSGLSSGTTYHIGVTASNKYGSSTQGVTQAATQSGGGGGGGGGSLQAGPVFGGTGNAEFGNATFLWLGWPAATWTGTGYSSCPSGSSIRYQYGYTTSDSVSNYTNSSSATLVNFTVPDPAIAGKSVNYASVAVYCVDGSGNKTSHGDLLQGWLCNTAHCRTNNITYPAIILN